MRRRVDATGGVPRSLASFDPADWPGRSDLDAVLLWGAARRSWVKAGNRWPGGAVVLLREELEVRQRVQRQQVWVAAPWK